MPDAPKWFLRELKDFDPDLRVRWSPRLELFQLERRVLRSVHPGTIRNDGWHDDWIRAQDGYLLVASIPPGKFSRTIFEKLRASDLWSNGGWATMAREMEESEEREEALHWEKFSGNLRDATKDVYDIMKIRDGRTVFNAGWV